MDGNPIIYVNKEKLGPLPAGTSQTVQAVFGDELTLKSESGELLGKWELQYRGQVVFSKDMQQS